MSAPPVKLDGSDRGRRTGCQKARSAEMNEEPAQRKKDHYGLVSKTKSSRAIGERKFPGRVGVFQPGRMAGPKEPAAGSGRPASGHSAKRRLLSYAGHKNPCDGGPASAIQNGGSDRHYQAERCIRRPASANNNPIPPLDEPGAHGTL